ncbi:ATP-binding cassette domain-containing protein [uncultured Corynebacterium sp.]|uniref:ABC transporter ATP-binding protein n=1 Tax=uncultured Corynebacterium sp. TaxID=159447 RepID=UPI0025D6B5AB|nr:ATP-binding cassette domain-containing protein [uncultured Corynebacterium sp.]
MLNLPPDTSPRLSIDCGFGHVGEVGHLTTGIQPGEIVVLTGENGAGKSTLIDTVAGELAPVTGTVRVRHGETGVLLDPAAPEAVGRVTRIADPAFLPDLTLGEHLDLMSLRTGVGIDDLLDRAAPWQLDDLPDTLPSRLSSGQRQRANLGIQLAVASDVIALDEPERHLDADWTRVLCDRLREHAREGAAIIVASHSPVVIAAADRVIRLRAAP